MRGGDPALLAVLPDHVHGLPSDLIVPVDGAQVTASSLVSDCWHNPTMASVLRCIQTNTNVCTLVQAGRGVWGA